LNNACAFIVSREITKFVFCGDKHRICFSEHVKQVTEVHFRKYILETRYFYFCSFFFITKIQQQLDIHIS